MEFSDGSQYAGILEAIYLHYCGGLSPDVVLLRCLDFIDPGAENILVVHRFCNRRYSYRVSPAGQNHTNVPQASDLLQPIVLLVDLFWVKTQHVINHR